MPDKEIQNYLKEAEEICWWEIRRKRLKCIPTVERILEVAYMLYKGFVPIGYDGDE